MKLSLIFSAVLATSVRVLGAVIVQPRYSHNIESLKAREPSSIIEAPIAVRQSNFPHLEKRANEVATLGSFDLGINRTGDVLFSVAANIGSSSLTNSVSCASCYLTGVARASTAGFTQNQTLLANAVQAAEELAKDPGGFLAAAIEVDILVDLENLSGRFELDINFDAGGSFSVPLLPPFLTPLGGEIDGNEVGIIVTLDAVFNVGSSINLQTGFEVSFPQGAHFTFNPITGVMVDKNVDGVQLSGLPFQVSKGDGSLSVALRVGVKAGLGLQLLGTGFDISAGVYADIPNYQAAITYDPEAACQLSFTEGINGDAAAYAEVGASVDYIKWVDGPKTAVTFWSANLPGGCIASSTSIAITVPAIAAPTATLAGHCTTTSVATPAQANTVTYTPTTGHSAPAKVTSAVIITNPVNVSILQTPITGSFATGSSISVPAPRPTFQAIAPNSFLALGNAAPTATFTSSPAVGTTTPIPGFIGAQSGNATSTVGASLATGGMGSSYNANATQSPLPLQVSLASSKGISVWGFVSALLLPCFFL